ncbi:unnamed protein product [Mytilus coruscus]|uniref:Integrase catalytic domain-containing protein n=1 Tax=Mytilus coruscus TaxID=42192 RepID=A0A6J8BH36_MYTCO|nr:unnamed protein product [Mytilus coruscus]
MLPSEIPEIPWHTVGTDLFHWNGSDYLIVVDYYSRYFEIAKLENISAKTVITHVKSISARHGIPTKIRSDSGSQYASAEFQKFAKIWNFEHVTSSPYHQQSNGLAEKYVNIALLDYRNTPINDVSSPGQLLMNRRLRGKLPATQKQLTPKVPNIRTTRLKMKSNKIKQKNYYDIHAKKQQKFSKGQTVRYQHNNRWKPAIITKQHDQPRSYTIQTPFGNMYRRNTKHILKTNENFENVSLEDEIPYELPNEDTVIDKEKSDNSEQPYTTRSGRTIRPPVRYKDYVN